MGFKIGWRIPYINLLCGDNRMNKHGIMGAFLGACAIVSVPAGATDVEAMNRLVAAQSSSSQINDPVRVEGRILAHTSVGACADEASNYLWENFGKKHPRDRGYDLQMDVVQNGEVTHAAVLLFGGKLPVAAVDTSMDMMKKCIFDNHLAKRAVLEPVVPGSGRFNTVDAAGNKFYVRSIQLTQLKR
jgi:hypothetical protein